MTLPPSLSEKTLTAMGKTFDEQKHKGGPVLYMTETEWVNFFPITLGDLWFQLDEIQDAIKGALETLKDFRVVADGEHQPPLIVACAALDYATNLLWALNPRYDRDCREFDVKWHDDGSGVIVMKEEP